MPNKKPITGLKEKRFFSFEVRAERDDEHGAYISGRPIVFNQETDLGWMREIIDPEAIDANTDMRDVRFLVGHNTSMIPLARSRNNNANSTMQLMYDAEGLAMRANVDVENNGTAKELYSAAGRGDISGMSFMFIVDKDAWDDLESDCPLRHVRHISKIFEVSAVAFPAYEGTSLEAASEGSALESARASLESARAKLAEDKANKQTKERRERALEILRR